MVYTIVLLDQRDCNTSVKATQRKRQKLVTEGGVKNS